MLTLSRKIHERIRLLTSDGPIWIQVFEIDRGKVRIGIEAPKCVEIMREELIRDNPAADIGGEHV